MRAKRITFSIATMIMALFLAACGGEEGEQSSRLLVLLTDAPADLEQVQVTITGLQARYVGAEVQNRAQYRVADPSGSTNQIQTAPVDAPKAAATGSNEEGEWLRLQVREQTRDLLQLQDGKTAEVGNGEMQGGFYNRLRLELKKVQVTAEGSTHDLELPTGEALELTFQFQLQSGKGQEMVIDFDAEQSIQKTEQGYEIHPVLFVKHFRYTNRSGECSGTGECEQSQGQ